MNTIKLYTLHFQNMAKFYDTIANKYTMLTALIPGCGAITNNVLLKVIWTIVVIIEPLMSLIVVTLLLPLYFLKSILNKRPQIGEHLFMVYHDLLKERIVSANLQNVTQDCFYPISPSTKGMIEGKDCYNVFNFVTPIEVCISYISSILCIIYAQFITRGKYVNRNYASFEYLLTYYALKHIPENTCLYYANQIDRWAILFDRAPQKHKTLVQHGIEHPTSDWPVKLQHVERAYVLSNGEAKHLQHAIMACNPEYIVMKPTITLSNIPTECAKQLLIVAFENYGLIEKETYIAEALKGTNIKIYFKIHPGKIDVSKYQAMQAENQNIEIIQRQMYPRVDVVISYLSTLGVEYEAHGIPVLYYSDYTLDEMITQIKSL